MLACLLLCAALVAQTAPPSSSAKSALQAPSAKPAAKAARPDRATQKELARLLERARYWTDAALEEEDSLVPADRPVLYARLGGLWWEADQVRARGYLEDAFIRIERAPKNEGLDDAKVRLDAARAIFEDVGAPEPAYRARAVRVITQILDGFPDDWQMRENAMSSLDGVLADAAQNDPVTAVTIARMMIKHNSGNHFQSAWTNIAHADAARGSQLYQEALQQAARSYDEELIFGLGQIAFPSIEQPPDFPVLPARLKTAYLDLLYRALIRQPGPEESSTAVCGLFLGGARLIKELPPARMGAVDAIAQRCHQDGAGKQPSLDSELKAAKKQLVTADDYLRAADIESDLATRVQMKFAAAQAAANRDKDFARALDILDAFTPEEREKGRQWPYEWRRYGNQALQAALKQQDHLALQQLLDRAPDEQKPYLLTNAALALREKEEGLARSLYMEDRRTLERISVNDPQAYAGLIGLCMLLAPSELSGVLKFAVEGLNQIPAGDPKKAPVRVLGYHFGPIGIPSYNLANQDDSLLRAVIAELKSAHDRAAFRVSLTRSILEKYSEELEKVKVKAAK